MPCAVLEAPPGAGKTTLVPLALLEAEWLGGQRILVLEPRRLAARAAAERLAELLGEHAGQRVGYRMRGETKVGRATQIEVVTEGVLTRMLQSDPALEGVGCVVFDEFHERSLQADLGLALTRQSQQLFRPDLRILVMSATLDGAAVAALLAGGDGEPAPLLTSTGRSFPVETHYLARSEEPRRVAETLAREVRHALRVTEGTEMEGDVLAFLPGRGEIRRAQESLEGTLDDVAIRPLYGSLPRAQQDAALRADRGGRRTVILATDIAETSLTVEGVRVVVDGGLARRPVFDASSGLTRLVTERISRASADQRRGRAGRLGPGLCFRCWTTPEHAALAPHTPPEIASADLASLALDLARWGAAPEDLAWLDAPAPDGYATATDLLRALGAIDAGGAVTPRGERMGAFGLHPRLAHLLLEGHALGLGALAADLAALLGERDLLRSGNPTEAVFVDLRLRLDALRDPATARAFGYDVARGARERVRKDAATLRRRLHVSEPAYAEDVDSAGVLAALAYPDRIGQLRTDDSGDARLGRYHLSGGRGAFVDEDDPLAQEPFLAACHLDARRGDARLFLAAPVSETDLRARFADQITMETETRWDADSARVVSETRERLLSLTLRTTPAKPAPDAARAAVLEALRDHGLDILPWRKSTRALLPRLRFLHHLDPDATPRFDDDALAESAGDWLAPYLSSEVVRTPGLHGLALMDALRMRLGYARRADLARLAPTHIEVPSGQRHPVRYDDPAAPVLAVRLQELFGLTETPRVGGGRVPLVLHLLSPARRPAAITSDLASFWASGYFDVRKDLRGRYPKHYWPEDPLEAEATHRAKPRKR